MAQHSEFGEVNLTAGRESSLGSPTQDTPFRIAILGDLGGEPCGRTPVTEMARPRAIQVDRDNFDEVLAKVGAGVNLPLVGNTPLELRFSKLDDFHPDHIFEQAPIFAKLRDLRARVVDPTRSPAVAAELGLHSAKAESRETDATTEAPPSVVSDLAAGSLLDAIIGQTEGVRDTGAKRSRAATQMDEFVRRVTEPYVVAAADPGQANVLTMIDLGLSAQMRALLHVPAFKALEACWWAVYFLVRSIAYGPRLKVYLIDISKEEAAADLCCSQDLRSSWIYRLIVEKTIETPGAEPWAVIVGNYEFGPKRQDAELLGRLAKVAKAAGAPFLAAASPRLLGCTSLAETPHPRDWKRTPDAEGAAAWAALRGLAEASSVGLCLPRFLLRLPYGKETDPPESFDFEEMTKPPAHEDYLWGNPAFACALSLAQSFSEFGWEMRPGTHSQIDGLPLHVFDIDGEFELKPCAEALLTEDAAERILDAGVMPLVSLKRQDAVRLVRFQSIAEPLRALAGRWDG